MTKEQEELTLEQTQTETLIIKAERELANVKETKPLNKSRKKQLETELVKLQEHRESLRKTVLEPQETV